MPLLSTIYRSYPFLSQSVLCHDHIRSLLLIPLPYFIKPPPAIPQFRKPPGLSSSPLPLCHLRILPHPTPPSPFYPSSRLHPSPCPFFFFISFILLPLLSFLTPLLPSSYFLQLFPSNPPYSLSFPSYRALH